MRGRGLLLALDLKSDIGTKLVDVAREDGLLINSPRPHLLRFMPSLNVMEDEIDRMLELLETAIHKAAAP